MSFYHILLSNAATKRFTSNRAALFSTPIDHAQQLNGNWEVGVTQLVYSNCVYTFDHEVMTINMRRTAAYQCEKGCRVYIPQWPKKDLLSCKKFIYDFLNKACKHIVQFTPHNDDYNYVHHVVEKDWIVGLSPSLRNDLGYLASALTSYDNFNVNYHISGHKQLIYREEAYYVDLIPRNEKTLVKKIVIKPRKTNMTPETLLKKFNYLLRVDGKQVATLTYIKSSNHIAISKLNDDDLVLVCSKDFHQFLRHRSAAVHGKSDMQHLPCERSNQFDTEWAVSLYRKCVEPFGGFLHETRVLMPRIITSVKLVVDYLNEVINEQHISFSEKEGTLSLTISGKGIELIMDKTLMDILGFDQNIFKSGTVTKASADMSLSRRINYFQIYSNIGEDVRVGDVEAPLLAMIPYQPKSCSILSEHTFKKVHYTKLKSNYIPQIDIAIYDDAGALIPFHKDAVTSITLHFRMKS